jgi:hypothetical protein
MAMLENGRVEEKVLVAAEDASVMAIPTHAQRYNNLVLVAQQGELPEIFAKRAVARMSRLARTSFRPRVGILALSAAVGKGLAETRALIAHALVASLDEANPELVLVGHGGFSDAARHELFALVQTLSEAAPALAVRVDLSKPAPQAVRRMAETRSTRSGLNRQLQPQTFVEVA